MLIHDLSEQDSLSLLSRVGFGRLACAQGGQPYIVPINFAIQEKNIYAFSTLGKKIEWMRENPLVCVEADEIATAQKWRSVIVLGRYHEIPNTAAGEPERKMVHQLLQKRKIWWEPGYARTLIGGHDRPLQPIYFRISIDSITGHATAERA